MAAIKKKTVLKILYIIGFIVLLLPIVVPKSYFTSTQHLIIGIILFLLLILIIFIERMQKNG